MADTAPALQSPATIPQGYSVSLYFLVQPCEYNHGATTMLQPQLQCLLWIQWCQWCYTLALLQGPSPRLVAPLYRHVNRVPGCSLPCLAGYSRIQPDTTGYSLLPPTQHQLLQLYRANVIMKCDSLTREVMSSLTVISYAVVMIQTPCSPLLFQQTLYKQKHSSPSGSRRHNPVNLPHPEKPTTPTKTTTLNRFQYSFRTVYVSSIGP
jgi:hypothetical protein